MQRLTLEFPRGEINRIERRDPFQNIQSIEILHFLRQDKKEFSLICRIELTDSEASIKQALTNNQSANAQILERESSGAYILFIKGRARKNYAGTSLLRNSGGYLVSVELNDKRIRTTYIGDEGLLIIRPL